MCVFKGNKGMVVIEKIAKLFLNVVCLFLLFVLYYCASSFTHIKRQRYLELLRLDKLEHYLCIALEKLHLFSTIYFYSFPQNDQHPKIATKNYLLAKFVSWLQKRWLIVLNTVDVDISICANFMKHRNTHRLIFFVLK